MEIATTKLSPNGQLVIPQEIREDAHIKAGERFIVISEGKNLFLKPMTNEDIKEEIQEMQDMREAEEQFRKGEYIEIDGNKSAEEIDKILMKAKL